MHRQLREWPDVRTPWGTVREMAEALIAERLSVHGRAIYAPYDEAARERFDIALTDGDRAALEAVPQLFPFARASEEANDALLALALEDGDPEAVARTVLSELPDEWNPAKATEREAALALHLGVALAREGNESYLRGLLGRLAASVPRAVSPFPEHQSRTIFELYSSLGPEPVAPPAPDPSFVAGARTRARIPGAVTLLGELMPRVDEPATRRLLFKRRYDARSTYFAMDAATPEQPLWEVSQPEQHSRSRWDDQVAMLPGRALIAGNKSVRSFDAADGSAQWAWRLGSGTVRHLSAARGLVFVLSSSSSNGARTLTALDALSGRAVWSRIIPASLYHANPVLGEDELVFLPNVARRRGLVIDLYTGSKRMDIAFAHGLQSDSFEAVWIEDGLLIVPWFHQSRSAEHNQVIAIELESGRLAWRVPLEDIAGGGRDLLRVLRWDDRTFLCLLDTRRSDENRPAGVLVELHTNLGATAELSGYRFDERFWELGDADPRVDLESPFWFQVSPTAADLTLHAVHLPFGHERWTARLQLSDDELYNGSVPSPVLSTETVAAMIVVQDGGKGSDWRSMLYFFGRDDGTPRGNQVIGTFDRKRGSLGMYGLGDALLVVGEDGLKVMR